MIKITYQRLFTVSINITTTTIISQVRHYKDKCDNKDLLIIYIEHYKTYFTNFLTKGIKRM